MINRVAHYLDTGEKLSYKTIIKKAQDIGEINEDSLIENNFVCSEKHRAFFKTTIGSSFTFNVSFQKWLKENQGKTYKDAIDAYYKILINNKNGKSTIDKQFEYNTYIRDFFSDNSGKSLKDAIKCWKYKKGLKGHNKYEKADLLQVVRILGKLSNISKETEE